MEFDVGGACVIHSARIDLVSAVERADALLHSGQAVTVILDSGQADCRGGDCGYAPLEAVEMLARLRLTSRRTGTPLELHILDKYTRDVAAFAGLW